MTELFYDLLADAVVVLHLLFILFALFGAWLVVRRIWVVFIHVPAVLWAAIVELAGWICPLTPLENALRSRGGGTYDGEFVQQYLLPLIYPAELTRSLQVTLGMTVLAVNLAAYGLLLRRRSTSE